MSNIIIQRSPDRKDQLLQQKDEEIAQLQQRLQDVETAGEQLLRQTVAPLQNEIKSLKSELTTLTSKNEDLTQALAASEETVKELRAREDELSKILQLERSELANTEAKLRQTDTQQQQTKLQVDQYSAQTGELNQRLKEQAEKLQSAQNEIQTLQRQLDSVNGEKQREQSEKRQKEEQLADSNARRAKLEADLRDHVQRQRNDSATIQQLTHETEMLKKEIDKLHSAMDALDREKHHAQQQLQVQNNLVNI